MKRKSSKKYIRVLSIAVVIGLVSTSVFSQDLNYVSKSSVVKVSGTSTIHDWTIESTEAKAEAVFVLNESKDIVDVKQLLFTVVGQSLKSGKSAMDKNTWNALKTKENPTISFTLGNVKEVKKSSSGYGISGTGKLSLAGVTKVINIEAQCTTADQSMVCKGEHKLNMTTFGMEPPSFMMGAVTTGEDVTITYDLKFQQQNKFTTKK